MCARLVAQFEHYTVWTAWLRPGWGSTVWRLLGNPSNAPVNQVKLEMSLRTLFHTIQKVSVEFMVKFKQWEGTIYAAYVLKIWATWLCSVNVECKSYREMLYMSHYSLICALCTLFNQMHICMDFSLECMNSNGTTTKSTQSWMLYQMCFFNILETLEFVMLFPNCKPTGQLSYSVSGRNSTITVNYKV